MLASESGAVSVLFAHCLAQWYPRITHIYDIAVVIISIEEKREVNSSENWWCSNEDECQYTNMFV